MSLGILFWILWILTLLFGLWTEYVPGQPYPFIRGGNRFLEFILIGLLGWATFGAIVK